MKDNNYLITNENSSEVEKIKEELSKITPTTKKRALEKFGLAALGSIPWVGGFISAAASIKTEEGTLKTDSLQTRWLEEHESKMQSLGKTLNEIGASFERLGEIVDERLQSEEFLDIVRKSFRTWDSSDTDEKRKYIANLISNSAGCRVCSDDVVRLFIDWLAGYHESHFAVIREIYKNPGVTRHDIWAVINGAFPREDSAEADLYKLLIRDLSTGGVIRQARETTHDGQFLKRKPKPKSSASRTTESAFENTKPYVLTELGKQFVHYTMNDVVTRVR
ncbi:hypothetical protein [Vibrio marisflavi]|uniref:Uncharacterized protein n=1 Tax=Vibrio marisflavi CECT 7928 TaxID=634439 RepID=A0ABN8E2U7_9VIBR|nr:hypothetical protein [Vibrio marisflavi]CAH0538560.1 hypothetical protein VMF7928_01482 [Vibrio marisflavi CECT 7928]